MKKKLIAAMALMAAAKTVHAELLYDGFSYAVGPLTPGISSSVAYPTDSDPRLTGNAGAGGSNAYGQTWYSAGSLTNNIQVVSPGLTAMSGMQASTGNTVGMGIGTNSGNSSRIAIGPFGTPSTGSTTVYYSMLVNIADTSILSASTAGQGQALAGFNTVGGSQPFIPSVVGARLIARTDTTTGTYEFGFGKNADATGSLYFDPDGTRQQGTTYLIVASYTLTGAVGSGPPAATDDTASIWINPDPSSFGSATPPTPTFTDSSATTDLSTGRIEALILRQAGTSTSVQSTGIQMDEVRVDTSWAGVTPQAGTTVSSTGGNWSNPGTWMGTAPDAANAVANLRSATPVTVTSDGSGHNLNAIYFNGPITLNGSQPITFNNGSTMNVEAGSPTVSAPIVLNSDMSVDVATSSTLSLTNSGGLSGGHIIRKSGQGTMAVDHVNVNELDVYQGILKLTGATSVVHTLGIPQITNNHFPDSNSAHAQAQSTGPLGAVDIGSGTLVVDYSGTSPQVTTTSNPSVTALIKLYGYHAGAWNGQGIISSTAAADASKSTGIGYAENSALGFSAYDSTAVIARYTYYGDANLDGTVNTLDFNDLASNYGAGTGTGTATWIQGDYNYNGTVDSTDFDALAMNFGKILPSMAQPLALGGAVVPEPTTLSIVGLLGFGLIGRRRR